MRQYLKIFLAICLIAMSGNSALAGNDESVKSSFGARLGFGVDPDQGVIGAQAVFGKMLKVARFAPSFDIGFGNSVTTYSFNADMRFMLLTLPKSNSALYFSAGPTLTHWSFKDFDSDTEFGISLNLGMRLPMGQSGFYNIESRLGVSDIPDFRLMVGILFGGVEKASAGGN